MYLLGAAQMHNYLQVRDSLKLLYQSEKNQDKKFDLICQLSGYLINRNNIEALSYAEEAVALAINNNNQYQMADAYEIKGSIYTSMGEIEKSLKLQFMALDVYENVKDQKKISNISNSIANAYLDKKDYDKAMDFYMKSNLVANSISDSNLIAVSLIGIGSVNSFQGDVQKALENTIKSAEIFKSIGRKDAEAVAYINAASFAYELGDKEKAIQLMSNGKHIAVELNNNYYNGEIHHLEAEWLAEEGNYIDAIKKTEEAITYLKKINSLSTVMRSYKDLSFYYEKAGDTENAYINLLEYLTLKDSSVKLNDARVIEEMNSKYNAVNQEKKIALLEKQTEMDEMKRRKNNEILYLSFGIIAVLLIFVIFIYRALSHKKQSNTLLEQQNAIIEIKNKEITDSLKYAQRIQNAIIPTEESIRKSFENAFVFYRPKDIVAGDFYWMEQVEDTILLAVADCTGHGVPGAMVSVVCHNALNRSVKEFGLLQPAEILNKTRELVIETFSQNNQHVKDGMDISLVAIKKQKNESYQMEWAGANNPLYIIRKETGLLEIFNGDKQPVGYYEKLSSFTNNTMELLSGDSIYLFSDGYMDQFGGVKGKKYKYAQFKSFIANHFKEKMKKQGLLLETEFNKWKGDFEQLDDVCVIGVSL